MGIVGHTYIFIFELNFRFLAAHVLAATTGVYFLKQVEYPTRNFFGLVVYCVIVL